MRVIFMGTPEFSVPTLKKLIDSGAHEVVGVFTQRPKAKGRGLKEAKSPVHELALNYNIPVYIPNSLKTSEIASLIDSIEADIIVVVAYGFIIPENILNSKKYGCLNIHPSALPKYRGAAPLQRTITNFESETAVCIIQMDSGLDTGDIMLQEKFKLSTRMTFMELHDKCAKVGAELLLNVLSHIDVLPRIPQSEESSSYAHKFTKEEGRINWSESAKQIDCKVRGMNPWPGTFFEYAGKTIKLLEAEYNEFEHNNLPRLIINEQFEIACGKGILLPKKLQLSGKSPQLLAEFLRGFKISAGDYVN